MKMRWLLVAFLLGFCQTFEVFKTSEVLAEEAPVLPPGDKEPLLRLEAGGPTSFVTALAFSPDGKQLYAGGWDKVVRLWALNEQGQFAPTQVAYRVPIGPGLSGAINCIALSPDGTLLAVAGRGVFREEAGFRVPGLLVPSLGAMNPDMLRDQGTIYVFDTRTQGVRLLRGHAGQVLSMAFAPGGSEVPPVLVSAAREQDSDTGNYDGVIRVWNAASREELAGIAEQPTFEVRPNLAVWRTGKGAKDLQVGFAWDQGTVKDGMMQEGTLRVWNVASGKFWKEKDGVYNTSLARMSDSGKLISSSFEWIKDRKADGRLRVWSYSPESGLKLDGPTATLPFQDKNSFVPRAISIIPSGPAEKTYRVAVTYAVSSPDNKGKVEYRLRLLDGSNLQRIDGVEDFSLWKSSSAVPVMAASSQGYLAVAGNDTHDIHIYSVKNLLANQTEPQIIHSVGSTFRYVSFATKGKDLGLLLSETRHKPALEGRAATAPLPALPRERVAAIQGDTVAIRTEVARFQAPARPGQGDLLFDFSKQPLTGDIRDWKPAAPAADGWQVRVSVADGRAVLSIFQGQDLIREIKLAKGLVLTDYALLPPRPPLDIPILAVASHDIGQPLLELYNGKTGEQIRQLTGHMDPISCLAFSADGRLLASVAEDQTVSVWSLTTLDQILGKRGLLPGLAVKDQKGSLVVGKIHDDSPVRGKLAVGEVIEGLVENGKVRAPKSPYDFYFTVAKMKPGTQVTLRVRGKDGARDVSLQVGQGIDERKPLFSLFVTKSDRQWVGWNPIGRFESSGPKAETYIGWHFNTGETAGPTRFALAEEYHKKYYQEGVLKDLIRVDQGEIKKLPPPPPPPAPKLSLLIEEEGLKPGEFPEPDAQGQIRLRHPRATLRISIIGRPVDTLKAVTWKMDDGAEQNLDLSKVAGQEIAVPLELGRGVHRLRVIAKTPEGAAEYSEGVSLRYQPPSPTVKYTGEKTILVKEPEFNLRALLQSGSKDEPVQVTFSHFGSLAGGLGQKTKDRIISTDTETHKAAPEEPKEMIRKLKLAKGYNLVEITAINQGAVADAAEPETSRVAIEINYFKEAGPPVIALRGIKAEGGEELKIEPGLPVRVHVPSIQILGDVTAAEDEDLVEAAWAQGAEEAKPLTTFEPKKKELAIHEKVELKPGPQAFRFSAKTATSPKMEPSAITVDYQPLVPQVALTSPRGGEPIEGEEESIAINVQASLGASKDRQPFQAKVLVNGQELADPAPIDESGRLATAKNVPLKPGTNLLRVKLANQWGSTSLSEEVAVRYLRPPRILALNPDKPNAGDAVASLEAQVRSATPLLPKSVKLTVNDVERTPQVEIAEKPAEGDLWTVRLTNVPLEANALTPTTNKIQLRISNEEGDCKEAAPTQVVYTPRQPPPVAEFTQPVDNISVTRADFKVHFQVQSKSPLEQVKLLYENHPPIAVDIGKAEAQADGSFLLAAEVPLHLDPKVNTLRIEAVNKGGVQDSRPLEINYLYRPVRVAIDSVESAEPGSKPIKPDVIAGGLVSFPPVGDSEIRLQGKVLWDEADDERLQKAKLVRVYVNGFQQFPAELKPVEANQRERAFETTLVLGRFEENRVEIVLPDLEKDASNRLRFLVDCRKPEQRQRLHLLMVSTQEKDETILKDQMLRTFRPQPGQGPAKKPAFDPVTPYGPLVGSDVEFKYINHQLQRIKHSIRVTKNRMNEVVVLYYHGGEGIGSDGSLPQITLGTSARVSPYGAITCDNVVASLGDTPGAQLLLLDVDRDLPKEEEGKITPNQVVSWGEYYPRVGMLHYAWLGPHDAPKDPGLIRALQQAMAQSTRLVEVTTGVGKIASASPEFKKFLVYETYLPRDLESLPVR